MNSVGSNDVISTTHSRVGVLLWISALLGAVFVSATTTHAITSISQGYATEDTLSLGSLVSLERNTTDRVVGATTSNVDNLFGVVINSDSSLLSVTNGANQVQVANSGTVAALISDVNGAIKSGDHITASPIKGVGMKATGNTRIIGIAQADAKGGTKQTYKDKNGQQKSATLGQVPVMVNVAYYFKEPERTIIPSAIQNVANALAGRQVSALPILLSAGIFLITLIVVSSIIYSMIRSSIISVGRNPMSQSAIYRDMIQMSALVLGILTVAVVSIYFVLTRL